MQLPLPALLTSLTVLLPLPAAAQPTPQPDLDVIIEGKGWGHGVGMAQDGAYAMGLAGASAADILSAFYPGTSLGRRGGSVRVDLFDSPSSSVVISFPGGGEVVGSGDAPGFPVTAGSGGSVRLTFDGGQYQAIPLDGASAAPLPEPEPEPDPAELASPAPAGGSQSTTSTTPSLLGLIPLPAPPTTPPTPAPTTPPPEPTPTAEGPPEPTSAGPLTAIPNDGSFVAVPDLGGSYRGTIDAVAGGGGLQLVNELDVEEYLRGMGEVFDPAWPAAALQAQAIAARTYALDAMAAGRALCSGQQCQVYLGASAEYGAMNQAVAATRGEVVTYGGGLAEAVYSANGGGISATAEEGFGRSSAEYPYLQALPYPTNDPMPWDVRLPLGQLAARMGYGGQPSDVTVSRAGPSGRVMEITITGDAGPQTIDGRQFASSLQLRSSLFTLRLDKPGQASIAGGRGGPRRLGRPAAVLSYGGGEGGPTGRAPWAALALLLAMSTATATGAYRLRQVRHVRP